MRMWTTALLVLATAACAGSSPGGVASCTGDLYDKCLDEHQCTSEKCYDFTDQSFSACSVNCTPGDDTPCMATADGTKATCVAIAGTAVGICTPHAANDCVLGP
jgi:hypothetical protein